MPTTTLISFIRPRALYEAGFSGTVTVPEGVTCFQAWVQAAGGGGRERADVAGSAGGGGGFSYFYSDVLEAEWGTSITLSVGAGASETDGDPSTLSGTLNATAFSITANGGESGKPSRDGVGGTASGGTTNVSGADGTGYVATPIDERTQGIGGAAGGDGQDLTEIGGAGTNGALPTEALPGEDGYIAIEWG